MGSQMGRAAASYLGGLCQMVSVVISLAMVGVLLAAEGVRCRVHVAQAAQQEALQH